MLLELSRTENKLALEDKSFNLTELISELVRERKAEARVKMNCPEHINIPLHHTATRELCAILLDNSLKHSPKNSVVKICIIPSKQNITVNFINDGTISQQTLPHVFERFFRGNQQTKGYGLGLPLAEQLTKALGGQISVSTSKNSTIFTISLPIL
jgi:signal transduction histidine kinase